MEAARLSDPLRIRLLEGRFSMYVPPLIQELAGDRFPVDTPLLPGLRQSFYGDSLSYLPVWKGQSV